MATYYDTTPGDVKSYLQQNPYSSLDAYGNAFNKLVDKLVSVHSNSVVTQKGEADRLNNAIDTFKNLFENNVGRPATEEDVSKFLTENGTNALTNSRAGDEQNLRNGIAQYVGDAFQKQAQETSQAKLTDLQSQAGSLADQYTQMGKTSLGNLADELKNYQVSLFDKLRPQLNLAAQAGGFQDSGGQTLQEQGALKDLANEGSYTLAQYQKELEDNANQIRFQGASDPYSLSRSFAINQPDVLANMGNNALNFNNSIFENNLNYQHQLGLLNAQLKAQQELQPSFGSTLGQSFANSFGKNAGSWFGPQSQMANEASKGAPAGGLPK